MTQGERIKEIRKSLNFTMEKFGGRLGVGRTAISNIENNNRNLTDQMAISICREFNVNETWLRTGEGDMFEPMSRGETIAQFAGELMKDEDDSFRRRLIEALAQLDEKEWEILEGIAKKLTKKDWAAT